MVKIIGYRIYDYTSKKTGQSYKACNLYVTTPADSSRGEVGESCESVFMRADILGSYSPKVGDRVRIYYNRYGSVEDIDVAK